MFRGISECHIWYEGRDIGENTAKSYVAQVNSFLSSFSMQGLESMLCIGDRGGLIEVKLRELTAGTVMVYLFTLKAFLKWFKAQLEWLQEVDLTSDRVATIVPKVACLFLFNDASTLVDHQRPTRYCHKITKDSYYNDIYLKTRDD